VVIVFLVLVWAAVLGPLLWRKWGERYDGHSVDAFHRQLRVLRRAAPHFVDPAFTLRDNEHTSHRQRGSAGHVSHSPEDGLGYPAERRIPGARVPLAFPTPGGASPAIALGDRGSLAFPREVRRARAQARMARRRRKVLAWLIGVLTGTLVLGAVPSLHPLWVITVLTALALGAYVFLLRQMNMKRRARSLSPGRSWASASRSRAGSDDERLASSGPRTNRAASYQRDESFDEESWEDEGSLAVGG